METHEPYFNLKLYTSHKRVKGCAHSLHLVFEYVTCLKGIKSITSEKIRIVSSQVAQLHGQRGHGKMLEKPTEPRQHDGDT